MNNCADVRVQKWDSVADSQVAIPAPRFAKIYDRNVILLGSILGIQGKLFIISRNILIVHIRLTIAPGAEIIGEGRGWHASWRQPGFQWVTMVTDSTARWILRPWLRNHRIPCFCILLILLPGFKSRFLEPVTMARESQGVFSRKMTEKSKGNLSFCLCAIILLSPINTELWAVLLWKLDAKSTLLYTPRLET
jgi:hypothetical protein